MLSGYGDSLTQPKLEYITTSCAVSFVQIQVSRVVDINESSEGIIPYLSIKIIIALYLQLGIKPNKS